MTDEKCRSVPKEKCRNVPRQECKKVRKNLGNQKKVKIFRHQKKVQRKTSGKLSNIIKRLKNTFLRCQNSSVRPRYPAMGEGGNECCLNMVRGKAKKEIAFFLTFSMSAV